MKKFLAFFFVIFFLQVPFVFSKNPIPSKEQWIAGAKKEINARVGPGLRYPIRYVYKTIFLPFKVIAFKSGWYKVQDFDGEESWILGTMLTRKNPVFLIRKTCPFYKNINDSQHYALLLKDVILHVKKCSQHRCFGKVRNYKGWFNPLACGWGATPGLKPKN